MNGGVLTLTNAILWENRRGGLMDQQAQIFTFTAAGATSNVNFTCIQGLTGSLGGTGNIGSSPLFVDANGLDDIDGTADDNVRLTNPSPCRNLGSNAAVPADAQDVDDDLVTTEAMPDRDIHVRIVGPVVDMGAYENTMCQADLNGNCVVDTIDLGILLASWTLPPQTSACGGAIPCPSDLNGDGVVNSLDLGILLVGWTLPPATMCDPQCRGSGSMMMGGGGSGPSLAGPAAAALAQPVVDPPTLDPDLLLWLMSADIQDLWAWYLEVTGGATISED